MFSLLFLCFLWGLSSLTLFLWGPIPTCCIYTIRLLCCRAICNKSYSISILLLFAHETLRPEGPTNTFSGPTKIAPSSCKSDTIFTRSLPPRPHSPPYSFASRTPCAVPALSVLRFPFSHTLYQLPPPL